MVSGLEREIFSTTRTDRGLARFQAWGMALTAADRNGVREACEAARDAAQNALQDPYNPPTREGVGDAAIALVTWDLATEDGLYTIERRDLLYGPWERTMEQAQKLNPGLGSYRPRMH